MKVLILGAGPAGLFAAHAAAMEDCKIIVASKPRKSFMHGAQYLHRPIPGLSLKPNFTIDYVLEGTAEEYKNKVYRNQDMRGKRVSPEDLVGRHSAWDIREAYDAAWDLYGGDDILPLELTGNAGEVAGLVRWAEADMVISTVPATLLCEDPTHTFTSEEVWATDKAMSLESQGRDNVVVCSGDKDRPWYRQSRIQGWGNTEYPHYVRPPHNPVWKVVKPISSTCTCYPDIIRAGRYGLWEKGVLSDGAFYATQENIVEAKSR